MELARLLLATFRGRPDVFAVGSGSTFAPEHATLTPERLEADHLGRKSCLGFYLLDESSRAWCSCLDFDSKPGKVDYEWNTKTERVYFLLANHGLAPLVELSQSGMAAHVWLFFSEPVEAWLVRAFWRAILAKLDIPTPEIYPRQDKLAGKGLGNLVRYPLWNQSEFRDVEAEWALLDPVATLSAISRTDAATLRLAAWELAGVELRPESGIVTDGDREGLPARVLAKLDKQHTLLARRWFGETTGLQDQSRSALVQSLACELVRAYVPTPEIVAALRFWCKQFRYEKGDRDGWVESTVAKAYDFVLHRIEAKSAAVGTLKQAAHDYLSSIEHGQPAAVPSGVADLDAAIDGVGFGEVAILAARPGHGKTALAMQWVLNAAGEGIPCLVLSEEMSRLMLGKRTVQTATPIDEDDWQRQIADVRADVDTLFEGRELIRVRESCGTVQRAEELIDEHCRIDGVRLVAVDYLQLLGSGTGKRYDDVSEVSRRLKQAAQRNNCAMLLCCQLNREIEKRPNFVPQNSDLRESGQIEQDADLVLFLQWMCRFGAQFTDPSEYRIYCTKRRNGPVRASMVETRWNPQRQLIGWKES